MMVFDFYDFSRYRPQLMGISMIFIMLFHAKLLPSGNVGVEFFLLISAIGLYFSLSKNAHIKSFYEKRVIRILPTYLIVAIPYFLYINKDDFSIANYLIDLSGLCIFKSHKTFWFIGQILVCYLLAPFYFKLLKYKYSIIAPFVTLVVCFMLGQCFPDLEIMLSRFAIFFLGFHIAELVFIKKQIRSAMILPIGLLAVIAIIAISYAPWYVGCKRALYFFLTVPALMLFIIVLKKCPKSIHNALIFIGGLTLEIYMLHEQMYIRILYPLFGDIVGAILSFPLSIFAAYYLNKLVNVFVNNKLCYFKR